MILRYPEYSEIDLAMRPALHPLFQAGQAEVSEFTFANIYLFREKHGYKLSALANGTPFLLGKDKGQPFFALPFGLPEKEQLQELFAQEKMIKNATKTQAELLREQGFRVEEDRNNFDYLYDRQNLMDLSGRYYHKKRNLIKSFTNAYNCTTAQLTPENGGDALQVLENWHKNVQELADFSSAKEALEHIEALDLHGSVYLVDSQPVAYVLGEFIAGGQTFVAHFEKADIKYKGLYQYINQSFATSLPASCSTLNREQDLGDPGLRKAKQSYKSTGFVEKFRIFPPA